TSDRSGLEKASMTTPVDSCPDLESLRAGLASIFRVRESAGARIDILQREPNACARTFPSEFVSYRRENGKEGRLFCKYMYHLDKDHEDHGIRGGVEYEALVYERVLAPTNAGTPAIHGVYRDATSGAVWLILEAMEFGEDVQVATESRAAPDAAAWIGRFHAV